MNALVRRVGGSVGSFNAESRVLGFGRTVIALAQATVFLFTPASHLFVPVGGDEVEIQCDSAVRSVTAYCLLDGTDRQIVSWIVLAILLVVASGLLPRYTSVLHAWAALSIHTSFSLPDGGETVAQVCTLFLVLACANDRRTWHWQAPRAERSHRGSAFQGIAWAGHWGLRLQVAYIYLNSALAKLSVGQWQDGTATYYVSRMETFGASGVLADPVLWFTALPVVALATTWGTIAAEVAIAVLVLVSGRKQLVALALSVCLHLVIVVQIGIVSFGFVMVGVIVCATARSLEPELSRAAAARRAAPNAVAAVRGPRG
ncbi:sporulation-delaying protein SdpB family protein [Nocardiopsis coralli]|uniref:sporulation-delaying protein SdpB family protein n=1 Tax=Nocardiopsis coralli TaxID=2772213 RepID=UPI001F1FE046|nr:sporulation-delaying protein SdpB family protein [Nocardiopsis coralli]